MPGTILTKDTTIQCGHGATATAVAPQPRVTIAGGAVLVAASTHAVPGCPLTPPSTPPKCVTLAWMMPATRVTAGGVPVLISTSMSQSTGNGTPGVVASTQSRVVAT